MHKLIALYKKPDDEDAFMAHYNDVHMPLVRKIPGLEGVSVSRVTGSPMGGDPEYFLLTEMRFPDRATFDSAMSSPENREAGKDLMRFARGLVTLVTAEE